MAQRPVARFAVLLLAALALLAGIGGGLLRAGVGLPGGALWAPALLWHAALMIGGFFGTVIAVERAVAVRTRSALLVPAASALAGPALLLGVAPAGAWLLVLASLGFVGLSLQIIRLQRAPHTVMLLVAALAWLAGNLLFAWPGAAHPGAVLALWFAFLVITIAAERLEMTRLMRRRAAAQPALFAIVGLLLLGALLTTDGGRAGDLLYGASLVALAAWLGTFDIAKRTVAAQGLARYMAVCLLAGYAWLAVAGLAWIATALGAPLRDVALHSVGLGFVVSMVMAHAPVILPAVARVKLRFNRSFYAPLALLHASLMLRFVPVGLRDMGASLNAVAIAWFALTMLAAGWAAARGQRVAGSATGEST